MATLRTALYPGSFDPVTLGHVDVIQRGLALFDHLIVGVADNLEKSPWFGAEQRRTMIAASVADSRLEVAAFSGLAVDYARQRGAQALLRGLRAVGDFEFEFQLAHLNRRQGGGLETVFVMTGERHFFVSSRMVRDIARHGGRLDHLVPEPIIAEVDARCRR